MLLLTCNSDLLVTYLAVVISYCYTILLRAATDCAVSLLIFTCLVLSGVICITEFLLLSVEEKFKWKYIHLHCAACPLAVRTTVVSDQTVVTCWHFVVHLN